MSLHEETCHFPEKWYTYFVAKWFGNEICVFWFKWREQYCVRSADKVTHFSTK